MTEKSWCLCSPLFHSCPCTAWEGATRLPAPPFLAGPPLAQGLPQDWFPFYLTPSADGNRGAFERFWRPLKTLLGAQDIYRGAQICG